MPAIIALCGGVGGAKLAYGFARVLPPQDLAIIVNTGDDFEHFGLRICPDVDTVMYTLAGVDNRDTGWGRAAESWAAMNEVGRLGGETWFKLGAEVGGSTSDEFRDLVRRDVAKWARVVKEAGVKAE